MPIQSHNSLLLPRADAQSLPGLASPESGSTLLGVASFAHAELPFAKSALGDVVAMQPHLGMRRNILLQAHGSGSSGISAYGMIWVSTGTATARTVSTTNVFSATRRVGLVSATAAGSVANIKVASGVSPMLFRGGATELGGFSFVCSFGISDASYVNGSRLFVGLLATASSIGNVNPSTLTNIIGVGADAGDATLSIMHNDGSGTATKINTGLPANTTNTDWYTLFLYCPPNHDRVYYLLRRQFGSTGELSFFPSIGTGEITTDMPSATELLSWQLWRNNGATASAVGFDFGSLYIETPT